MSSRPVRVEDPPDMTFVLASRQSVGGKTLFCIQPQFGHFRSREEAETALSTLHDSVRKLLTPIQIHVQAVEEDPTP